MAITVVALLYDVENIIELVQSRNEGVGAVSVGIRYAQRGVVEEQLCVLPAGTALCG